MNWSRANAAHSSARSKGNHPGTETTQPDGLAAIYGFLMTPVYAESQSAAELARVRAQAFLRHLPAHHVGRRPGRRVRGRPTATRRCPRFSGTCASSTARGPGGALANGLSSGRDRRARRESARSARSLRYALAIEEPVEAALKRAATLVPSGLPRPVHASQLGVAANDPLLPFTMSWKAAGVA